jgi:hypothetical protein
MHHNVTEAVKTNEPVTPNLFQFPVSFDNPLSFQNFFLSQDQNQNEAIETDKIDFGETTQHSKIGKSVFIKYENQETLESKLKTKKEEEPNFWYFTHC